MALHGNGLSTGLRVMIGPAKAFRAAVESDVRGTWWRAFRTPLSIAVLFGIVTSIAATGRITAWLVAGQTAAWAFVPALQLLTAMVLVTAARERRVSFPRAVELFFAGHAPWSLWLVFFAASHTVAPSIGMTLLTALVPLVWTARIVSAYAREVLALPRRSARARAMVHQVATVLLIVAYIDLATALSVRVMAMFAS